MRKRTPYRTVQVKDVQVEKLSEMVRDQKVVVGIDNAKEVPVAAVMMKMDEVLVTFKWKQPKETREVVELLGRLGASKVEVAMEPSGTYGDALRAQLWAAGMEVYRVSPKRVHDAAELYDGVPSKHDAKDAAIIGKLHLEGRSERWPLRSEAERDMVAAVRLMGLYEEQMQRGKGQLEALLTRHWPALDGLLELGSATQLGLLCTYGSAKEVAKAGPSAAELMQRVGGPLLGREKIEAVLESARHNTGWDLTGMERRLMMELCSELDRSRLREAQARAGVHGLLEHEPVVQQLAEAVGKTTAAVLYAELGDPRSYEKSAQYVKSLGLNLKEKSSGKNKGAAHITKRGSSMARQYLYLAVLRKLRDCPVVRAWFERKQGRDGGKGKGGKAIVAIMRKLGSALWHVARGAAFDPEKLYNVRALGLEPAGTGQG